MCGKVKKELIFIKNKKKKVKYNNLSVRVTIIFYHPFNSDEEGSLTDWFHIMVE
jgi:hypothetical protein